MFRPYQQLQSGFALQLSKAQKNPHWSAMDTWWASCISVFLLLTLVPSGIDAQQTVVQSVQCGFLDLSFVVDHSGSISDNDEGPRPNWDYILDFMVAIVQGLEIGYDFNRVAIVTFGNDASIDSDFAHSSNKQDLINTIRNLTNTGGNTNTTGALRLMRQGIFASDNRVRAAKVCVLITDGVPSKRYEADGLPAEADAVKNAGIRIIGVGVTTAVNDTLMRTIVSNPTTDYFEVMTFSDLPSLLTSLTNQFCTSPTYTGSTTATATASTGSIPSQSSTTTGLVSPTSSPIPTSPAPPKYNCRNQADVVVLIDASGDMTLDTFRIMRTFVANMAYSFNTSNDFTRLSVVEFADTASSNIYLNTFAGKSEADLAAAIRALQFQGGGTNTAAGLSYVMENAFTAAAGDRPNVPNILLMLVAGPSNNLQATLDAASALKDNFTQVISIGINGGNYATELNSIVSYPYASNRILVNSPSDLPGVMNQTMDMLCNNINECLASSCQNGGTCVDSINRFICFCQAPYAGANCELMCQNPADVVFVLDGSGSIGPAVFLQYIEFLRQVVTGLNDDTRVGVLIFSDSWKILFQLNTFDNKQNIINALYAYYPGGTTNTAGAIQEARDGMFTTANGDRPNDPNILVLITDGMSNDQNATIAQAIQTRTAGISILAVGVGDQINQNELEAIASYPATANVIRVEDEASFSRVVPTLVQALCSNQNVCQSSPCRNGGSCTNLMGGFNCSCPTSFTGEFCERGCSAFVDLVFVIDSSGSIRLERFPAVLDFFTSIVEQIEVSPSKTRIGAISFSDTADVNFKLNSYTNKGDVISAIKRIQFLGLKTNIASALLMLKDTMYLPANGGRSNAQKVAVLFTDGDSNVDTANTIPYAVDAKNAQIFIVVVGLGTDIALVELRSIASRPLNRTVLTTPLAADLPSLLPGVVSSFCNDTNECASTPCQNGVCFSNFGSYYCQCSGSFAGINCDYQCTRIVDLAFVLDYSGTLEDNTIIETLVSRTIYGLAVSVNRIHVAVVTYSDNVTVLFYLNTYTTQEQVQNALTFGTTGGRTNTKAALQSLYQSIFITNAGYRFQMDKIAVLITRGQSNVDSSDTVLEAQNVRNAGIELYVVAQGSNPNYDEINGIATQSSGHVLNLTGYGDVDSIARTLQTRLCNM